MPGLLACVLWVIPLARCIGNSDKGTVELCDAKRSFSDGQRSITTNGLISYALLRHVSWLKCGLSGTEITFWGKVTALFYSISSMPATLCNPSCMVAYHACVV